MLDALGNAIEQRDSKGALVLSAFDVLNRPVDIWARDDGTQRATLRQHLVYGDSAVEIGIDQTDARQRNALGQLVAHYDEGGRVLTSNYDFKGNLLEKTRQVISDQEILSVFAGAAANNWQVSAYQVDWQPEGFSIETRAAAILDPTEYTTSTRYYGLARAREVEYPRAVDNEHKVLQPRYNRAGALENVTFDGDVYVERIAYDAKGQRTLIAYGNGVMTRYAYDPRTFRLSRLRSERYSQPDNSSYQPTGLPLQDFGYEYDLAGNIMNLRDRTPESGIPNSPQGTDALDRRFDYNAIYRLLSATGRECDVRPGIPPWFDEPRCSDITRTRAYTERYQYDPMGNMLVLQHPNGTGGFTREFAVGANNNRLEMLTIGQSDLAYAYDASGNMTRETTSRHFESDYGNHMKVFRTQTDGAEPSVHAQYLYDSTGMRVKKLVRHQGGLLEVTSYIENLFEHHRRSDLAENQDNNTLHVLDDQQRIAWLRVADPFPGDTTPAVKFQLGDLLGSSNVVTGNTGILINREEFTPYGETSFGSYSRKRYRYTGMEHDEESGLTYHRVRYYSPWIARWLTTDPKGPVDGLSLYVYVVGDPINHSDPSGISKEGIRVNAKNAKIAETTNPQLETSTGAIDTVAVQEPLTPGSRLDRKATVKKSGKVSYVDDKSMNLGGKTYVDPEGNLKKSEVRHRLSRHIKKGMSDRVGASARMATEVEIRLLIRLTNSTAEEAKEIAEIGRTKAAKLAEASGEKPIKMGFVRQEKAEELIAKRAKAQKVLSAVKKFGPIGTGVSILGAASEAYAGNYETAAYEIGKEASGPIGYALDIAETSLTVHEAISDPASSGSADVGASVASKLVSLGANEYVAEGVGAYATLASVPVQAAIAVTDLRNEVISVAWEAAADWFD